MILDILQTILAFILVLAPLVFIHEFGHFIIAKLFRIGVPVFSVGFGPRLFGMTRGGTDYRVSAIPLGGYVRLAGDEPDSRTGAPDEFLSKPKWQRFFVFVAGATFNIILAFLAFWMLFAVYGKEQIPNEYAVIRGVEEGSTAAAAGIVPGDKIIEIVGEDVRGAKAFTDAYNSQLLLSPNTVKSIVVEREGERLALELPTGSDPESGAGHPGWRWSFPGSGSVMIQDVTSGKAADAAGLKAGDRIVGVGDRDPISFYEFQSLIASSPEETLDFKVERGEETLLLTVVPRREGERGVIGISFTPPKYERVKLGVVAAAGESFRTNVDLSRTIFLVLKRLVTAEVPLKTMSGPIGIARFAKQALISGPDVFIYLLGFFSLQLGILNLLPIPVLDGGHILILGIEGLLRRELSETIKERVMQVGFVFLLAFMGIIIWLDILKLT